MDSLVDVYKIRLPLSVLFFIKYIPLGKYSKYTEAYLILNESLLSRTYRMKSEEGIRNLMHDINLIFPHNQDMKTKHSFVKKFMGLFSLLTMPNAIFTYVVKVNEKMREATYEILIINNGNKNRVELQRIAYKIIQSFGYLVTNAY